MCATKASLANLASPLSASSRVSSRRDGDRSPPMQATLPTHLAVPNQCTPTRHFLLTCRSAVLDHRSAKIVIQSSHHLTLLLATTPSLLMTKRSCLAQDVLCVDSPTFLARGLKTTSQQYLPQRRRKKHMSPFSRDHLRREHQLLCRTWEMLMFNSLTTCCGSAET